MFILIVDDDPKYQKLLSDLLGKKHETALASDGAEALSLLESKTFDLILTDFKMPRMTGLELIGKAKEIAPDTVFMLMTAFGKIEQAVEAIRAGCDDYIPKPFDLEEMEHRIQKIDLALRLKREAVLLRRQAGESHSMVGSSAYTQRMKNFAAKGATSDAPVLLLGPSGSGKEVLARAIHERSSRSSGPFLAINCSALSPELIEAELFGVEQGAFTGAERSRPGFFEIATQGTLMLDEVGELSPRCQAALLRVLQDGEFRRVGGSAVIKSQARIIAATHRDLDAMIANLKFRSDLGFRLNVLSFELLPLADHSEDIPELADFFWKRFCAKYGRTFEISPEVKEQLLRYSYPGNIRELQNILERLYVLSSWDRRTGLDYLPFRGSGAQTLPGTLTLRNQLWKLLNEYQSLPRALDVLEESILKEAMDRCGQNQVHAAKLLGLSRTTLQNKLRKQLGLKKAA